MIWALLLLSLLLLMFLLVPVWHREKADDRYQSEENLRLYQERTDELAASDLDEEQKQALQLELDREFLASSGNAGRQAVASPARYRWPVALALLLFSVAGTVLLYQQWGAANELRATELLEKASQVELTQPERSELIERLAAAGQKQPGNIEWNYLRGRLLNANGDFAQAAEVFADILVALPEEATADRAATMTLLAQARFFAADQKADNGMYQLLKDALALTPGYRQALGMAGMLAFELKDYQGAVNYWRQLWLGMGDSPEAQMLAQGILRAVEHVREQGGEVDLSWMKRSEIKVLVDLSAEAKAAVDPADTVFVLARAVSGPPMPLAVQKLTVAQLPQVITLSDAQAMAPGMNLSSHEQVALVARISKSGQPMPQSGDWQAEQSPVSNHEENLIKLTISDLLP
ncbi:c-type cytochrome biogenesis protein CcmI [Thalassolituus alkanivorans]|uniref:c-type cytochrome biogenesis protein CcmI n=1 Tax=Thalassolituus alkanivorans TaxID=2881055 RepID=UPI001E32DB21|nr:c-type cytochrome biogenesis protein CcmI [Thalassolituus alkanivorans]MCB2385499.1 c-type cytochrome biogenesis protein CcmI [Thalassolituus alkanivorans]MCB2423245.1 c-type cytochrome biogenesis protein CcmI [Thalassolituus alkanivorans]